MKKNKCYYLTDEAINIIDTYKNENHLSSGSQALINILTQEYKGTDTKAYIRGYIDDILKQALSGSNANKEVSNVIVKEEPKEALDTVMEDSLKSMREALKSI